jgi:signal recognition particle GTPase
VSADGAGENFKSYNSVYAMAADLLANKLSTIDTIAGTQIQQELTDVYNNTEAADQEYEVIKILSKLLQNNSLVNSVLTDINNASFINYATKDSLIKVFGIRDKFAEVSEGFEMD